MNSRLFLKVYLWLALHFENFKGVIVGSLLKLKQGLATESEETKEMIDIYARFTIGKASKAEMNTANEQFRDLIKTLGLGVFLILPFAPLSIPVLVKLGRRLGVEILPSGFRESQKKARVKKK